MKIHAWFEENHRQSVALDFCGGTTTVFSRVSPHKNTPNEDAAALIEFDAEHGLLVIADGVGGHSAGDRAARAAIENVLSLARRADAAEGLRTAVLDAIESANREVLSWGVGAGATLAIVEFRRATFRTFHVGDVTVMLCSNRGRQKYSTVAHAPVAMAIESGMLEEEEGLAHEDRHLISNCIGSTEMKIEIGPPVEMSQRDTLIMGSDGLFDNLTQPEIIESVRKGKLLQQTDRLVATATERMENPQAGIPSKPDDLTLFCFRQGR